MFSSSSFYVTYYINQLYKHNPLFIAHMNILCHSKLLTSVPIVQGNHRHQWQSTGDLTQALWDEIC